MVSRMARLPVLNQDKRLVGIIAFGDIIKVGSSTDIGEALSQISRPVADVYSSNRARDMIVF